MPTTRAWIAVAGAFFATASTLALACSSGRPPDAVVTPSSADAGTTTRHVAAVGADGRLCNDEGFHEPTGSASCTCTYDYGANLRFTFPCGITICSDGRDGKGEAAVCSGDGRLTLLPGYNTKNCLDGNADLNSLPPCDAGTPTTDATITDGDADAGTTDTDAAADGG